MKTDIYTIKGEKAGSAELPKEVFGLPWNSDLVHQVVTSFQANARTPIAHAKDRSDRRGGGIKPWRQKGTGRARHGSIRSPLWIGGGVTHGPLKEKDYSKKVNKKMRTKALFTVLSKKHAEGQVLFLDSLALGEGKTKDAKEVLESLAKIEGFERFSNKKGNVALLSVAEENDNAKRGFKNIKTISLSQVENLNALDVLNHSYVVIVDPERSLEFLMSKPQ